MARKAFALVALLLLVAAGSLAFAEGPVTRWDAGFSGGSVAFSDAVGLNGMIETRAYLMEPVQDLKVFAGAGGLFQYTDSTQHTMTDFYGFALGGVDWFYPGTLAPVLEPLALRAQLALGGGYTSDVNSGDEKKGSAGFLMLPAVGADYGFGKLHLHLMFGYELKLAGGMALGGITTNLGLSYSIF